MGAKIFKKLIKYQSFKLDNVSQFKLFFMTICVIGTFKIAAEIEDKIAIATMFQNEAPYLKEWIEFHRLIGVSHFYLWNNQSEDDYLSVLQPYISEDRVELFQASEDILNLNDQKRSQILHMNEALALAIDYDWLIMIDTDEFIVPMQKDTLQDFLNDYKDVSAIAAPWICFGTSNVKKIPSNKLMIEVLKYRGPFNFVYNGCTKWIVRPKHVSRMNFVHKPVFKKNFYGVDQNKNCLKKLNHMLVTPDNSDKLRLFHYWSRDEDYFNRIKLPRQAKWDNYCLNRLMQCKTLLNSYKDDTMQRFIPQRRELESRIFIF